MPSYLPNEEQKAKFADVKKFASIDFNPSQAANGNATEVSSMLKMSKEEAEQYTGVKTGETFFWTASICTLPSF